MQVGERIRELRKQKRLTQEELANELGLKKVSIQKYENGGIVNFKKEILEKLGEIFEVSPAYIMGWEQFDEEFDIEKIKKDLDLLELIKSRHGYIGVELANLYNKLNEDGKRKVLFYAEDILEIDKYKSE